MLEAFYTNWVGMAKPSVEDTVENAARYFMVRPSNFPTGRPFNCCESVLIALSEYFPEMQSELIPKIGTVLGAGLSLTGNQCGALNGATICLGAVHGRKLATESPAKAWSLGQRLVQKFNGRFGVKQHPTCRELTGLDMRDQEDQKRYFVLVHDYACADRVRFATRKAIELVEENR